MRRDDGEDDVLLFVNPKRDAYWTSSHRHNWLEEGSTTAIGPSCVEKTQVDFSQSWQSVTTIGINPSLA